MDTVNKCENCTKTFSTKYTLKKHIDMKCCSASVKKVVNYTCSSSKCEYQTNKITDQQKHVKICRYVEFDTMIDQYKKEINYLRQEIEDAYRDHAKEIDDIRREHTNEMDLLKEEHKKELAQQEVFYLKKDVDNRRDMYEKEQERMSSLLEKVVSKPAVITNNHTSNTSIKGNNNSSVNHLQSVLASHDLYKKQTDAERIKMIDPAVVEKHFWAGQKGIARLSVKDIISVNDDGEEKMIICCTDPSRRRFKHVDENNNIVDDVDARDFIDKTAPALVNECRNAYDRIINKIEDNKKKTTDVFERDGFDNKSTIAQQKLLEISNIGDHNRNTVYKNEMARLLKK